MKRSNKNKSHSRDSRIRWGNNPDIVVQLYYRLLADVSSITRTPLEPPEITMRWVLIEAPKLEKLLLMCLEGTYAWEDFLSQVPEWLLPLVEEFVRKDSSPEDFVQKHAASILGNIRQVLLFGYKAEYEHTNEQEKQAISSFLQIEEDMERRNSTIGNTSSPILQRAQQEIAKILDIQSFSYPKFLPSHGPGAVFPSRLPAWKSAFRVIYKPIEDLFPFDEYFQSGYHATEEIPYKQDFIQECDTIECNMVFVPKDSRGPRTICVHPTEAVWIQQGCRRILEDRINHHPTTRGRINFDDQKVNGELALIASEDREYCTIDLKDASDRVSMSLVRSLLSPHWYDILSCCRASTVRLPDGCVHKLQKWAPMGNALTFPVESLIFWAVCRASIHVSHGKVCDHIYVFGDDIIVPTAYYSAVVEGLHSVGLIVNENKSFQRGFFRESCGVDAYRGVDVTPIRLKVPMLSSYSSASSLCSLAQRANGRGLERVSSYLYTMIRRVMGKLPLSNNPDTQGIYEYVDCDLGHLMLLEPSIRFNRRLHRFEVPVIQVTNGIYPIRQHDWCHVLDSLLSIGKKTRGLEYPVPYRARPQTRWVELL